MGIPSSVKSAIFSTAFVLVVFGAVYYGFSNRSLSGTYITHDDSVVGMFRLVETRDGKLSGQLEIVKLKANGTIDDISGSVDGVTDGKNINLSVVPSPVLVTIIVAGTRDGNNLILTASVLSRPPKTRIYTLSDFTTFQTLSNDLRSKSQSILAQTRIELEEQAAKKREVAAIAYVNGLVLQLHKVNEHFNAILSKPTSSDKKYKAITQQLQIYVQRIQTLPGNRFGYRRGQIVYAMNQGTFASNQIHFKIQSGTESFREEVKQTLNALPVAEQDCILYGNSFSAINPCLQFKTAAETFHIRGRQVENRLNSLEQAYQAEYKIQQGLIEEAGHVQ